MFLCFQIAMQWQLEAIRVWTAPRPSSRLSVAPPVNNSTAGTAALEGINSALIPLLSLPALCSASSLSCTQSGPYFANMIKPKWAEAVSMAPDWGQPNPIPVWDQVCGAFARCTTDVPKWQNPELKSKIHKDQQHLKIEGKQAICLLT